MSDAHKKKQVVLAGVQLERAAAPWVSMLRPVRGTAAVCIKRPTSPEAATAAWHRGGTARAGFMPGMQYRPSRAINVEANFT